MSAVIFDLDGVLVESEPYWQQGFASVVNAYAEESDWEPPGLTAEMMERYEGGRVDETLRTVLASIGHPEPAADEHAVGVLTDRVIAYVSEAFNERPTPIEASVQTARELHARGIRLAVASSSARTFIDTALRVIGLDHVFEARQSALDVDEGKPDPGVYLEILQRLGESAGACVAIEDSAAGVGAAAAALIPCIGLWRKPGPQPDVFSRCAATTDRLSADLVAGLLAR